MLQENTNASIYLKQRAMNQNEYMYIKRPVTGSEYSKTKVPFEKESREQAWEWLGRKSLPTDSNFLFSAEQ